ncbi:MAG: hypothetical protein AAGF47_03365 [Planctomycetota bacterium]
MTRTMTALALAALAGTATAQAPGDLLFISSFQDATADEINLLSASSGSVTNLVTFDPGTEDVERWGALTLGLNGEFFASNSPLPAQDPSTAEIVRIDGLLSGAPTLTNFSVSNPAQVVNGMAVDPFTGSLLVSNNPPSNPPVGTASEGLLAYDLANPSSNNLLVAADAAGPTPRFQAFGGGLTPGSNQGEFFFGTLNGGVETDPNAVNGQASTIGRLTLNDAGDPTNNTADLIFDGSTAFTGLDEVLSQLRGIDQLPNGNLVVAELNTQTIYEIALDGNGDFAGITELYSQAGTDLAPQGVIYNEFTGQLNFIERNRTTGLDEILAINLDGSGLEVLGSGLLRTGSLIAIPAPASAALLGLGGLAAARRRR